MVVWGFVVAIFVEFDTINQMTAVVRIRLTNPMMTDTEIKFAPHGIIPDPVN